ncbi:hypothetical protein AWW67_07730 [Roseivirga seohaensis]|uniref:Cyclic GMP-AMP synthase n=1 Tax=Roseivirga seohaensis TaxID=1914963 RepID=A0A150XR47_9BACT|nr:hypothetical protein [Roseivirga seohaensis]KYG81238.1 hypothetical protein AWW67_07730 [Roseivirga seohaensis]
MANTHNLFEEYNREIKLDGDRRGLLKVRRDDLRSRIKGGFRELKQEKQLLLEGLNITIEEEMEFQSQGSYVMDTIINPSRKEDEYDIDDGVYFMGSRDRYSRPDPEAFHEFVIQSIKKGESKNTIEEIEDRSTCVRVKYKGVNGDFNYHVDLPIYYAINVKEPDLADTKDGWYTSNPIEFIVWFEDLVQSGFKAEFILESKFFEEEYKEWLNDRRKADHQLRRIVRYLKAWGDHLKGDMPPGVVMTILAGSDSNFAGGDRDDVALRDTLVNIKNWLELNGFKCPRPTTPKGEDLFRGYSDEKKEYFRNVLNSFITSANQALENPNQKDASLKWQKHLGSRFPTHLAKDEIEGAKTYLASPVIKSNNSRSA